MEDVQESEYLEFYVHDELHRVKASNVPQDTALCDYLRDNAGLTGTKVMCREGGCGACVVTITTNNPTTGKKETMAVNSCLVSIFSCSKWQISTSEGIGNRRDGFHPIQKILASNNATQCGFCSPGMVMNMYALYKEKLATAEEIEHSFGGNMCRCTGYRPIVDAMRKVEAVADIEDCLDKCCLKCDEPCSKRKIMSYEADGGKWYKVFKIEQILKLIKDNPGKDVKLAAGNTAQGVYRDIGHADISVDINAVEELKMFKHTTEKIEMGGNVSLTDWMRICKKVDGSDSMFSYMEQVWVHLDLVAHVPVRNIGTIAGNLMIKHRHQEFQSDIYLLLAALGAKITLVDIDKKETEVTPVEFLSADMKKNIIKKVALPALDKSYKFGSYKIMPRTQNAHAIVNAGFLLQFEPDGNKVKKATVVFGAINEHFTHATATEKYLVGKNLFDEATLQGAFAELDKELKPEAAPPEPTPEFRKKLALALFYKYILSIAPDVNPTFKSGGVLLTRPLSKSTQDYAKSGAKAPIGTPTIKIEAEAQTSGEAEYIMDMPDHPNQLYGAFVCAKAPAWTTLVSDDPSEALKMKGVVGYINVKDIPGRNSYVPTFYPEKDDVFVDGTIRYFNQPVGVILGKTRQIAEDAVQFVKLTYGPQNGEPILTARQAIQMNKNITFREGKKRTREGTDGKTTIKGTLDVTWQYHYHMETQSSFVIPQENGEYDVYTSTQWMDVNQIAGAECLGIDANKINMHVRRAGGGYGGKVSRNSLVSTAALLACSKYRKPVKIWMPFIDNMNVLGKRNPCASDYTVSVDDKGVIQKLDLDVYSDVGICVNEFASHMVTSTLFHSYKNDTFNYNLFSVHTDNPSATWVRSPGSCEGLATLESVYEQIAYTLKLDPIAVRMANLDGDKYADLVRYMKEFLVWADIDKRKKEVEEFNKNNRWVKKGLTVIPMTYEMEFFGNYTVIVSVYHMDGSVAISHAGVEMGQGINTKAVQVVAATLNIPIEKISVKPTNNLTSPNAAPTGGSITSEVICMALQSCCQQLLERMEFQGRSQDWTKWVNECYGKNIDLTNTYMWYNKPDEFNYNIYGVAGAEVELDLLTGNHIINRVDLLEDTGDSISPLIDIGQVEGAYIMGIGYWTSEEISFTDKGELLNNRTWTYKPPGIKDIPVEFNVKFPEASNPLSPLKAKATGEAPLCLAFGVALALRQAIRSARGEVDKSKEEWFPIDGPCSVEKNFMNALPDYKNYTLK